MKANYALDHTVVTVHHDNEIVHLMIDLEAPEAPPLQRMPLDIVLVLDRSGSMGGSPLEAVTNATASLLRRAHPQDRIGVVTFESQAATVLALGSHIPEVAAAQVRKIQPGGSTNLSGGWLKAFEMLSTSPRPGSLQRIVVLTDGLVNAGITTPEKLGTLVGRGREHGITTSFIGFATEYDEGLLEHLAIKGSGNKYYCEGPDQASAVFLAEFDGLASVVAQNISIAIHPTSAVASTGVLNEYPVIALPNDGVQVEIGDAYGKECKRVLAGFHLRPLQHKGKVDIASIIIRWTSAIGNLEMHSVTIPVSVTAGEPGLNDPGLDPRVRDEVFVLKVAKSRKEAHQLINDGRTDDAANILEQAMVSIREAPGLGKEVAQLGEEIRRLRERLWRKEDMKQLKTREWEAKRKRKAEYRHEPEDHGREESGQNSTDEDGTL